MKKTMSIIMVSFLLIAFSGCNLRLDKEFISGGDFRYYYMEEKDSYAIVGTTEAGKAKDVLYFPAYYNGKLVTDMGYGRYEGTMGVWNIYWIENDPTGAITATKFYFPYTISDHYAGGRLAKKGTGAMFFANCEEEWLVSAATIATHLNEAEYYVTPTAYEFILQNVKDRGKLNQANTLFMFNYDAAPNKGYFFIDNYAAGSMIENTPYEPKREGYTFGGWYREAECRNEWDFTTDVTAGSNDEMENLETKLYAKWIKK